ncbi:MAG: V-type ATP synthase subunit D [Prochlorococcaceae cyanobacterium]|jgi:V/A-type H+-transporting ATPase subunit D
MSRLLLTKASLTHQKALLRTYGEVLPSLDLKRRQLGEERARARAALEEARGRVAALTQEIGRSLPMLANDAIDLDALVRLSHVELDEENLMGTRLPRLQSLEFSVQPYGLLTKPFWVDRLVVLLRQAIEFRLRLSVAQRRVALLDQAERTVTQRYNLFEKVLIPRTKATIKKISIHLADTERAAVVNSKIAKRKKEAVAA